LLPSDDYQKTRDFLASITCDHPVKSREHDVVAPGEKVRWQHSCVRGFFDEHGRILEYQAVDSDITERKRAEEATKNLAHAGRLALIGELTASIAHEVNQPLAAILSNAEAAELLLDSSPEQLGEVRQILSDIRSDDIRASEVIRRIRTFVQKRATERALLNLNDEITEVLVFLRAESSRRGITVELSLSESIPEMQGDKIQLQQVLVNLLLNSMEAMTDAAGARRLSVKTSMLEDGCVAIAISDSGIGIPPDQMPRLFEHFFSTKRSGMGLGLSIARSIVEAHGGTISAENNAASGATFRIVFPTESRAARERSLNSEGVLLESSS
jgi:C4-dicarboxylate-specific signal transduction histidine kinase